MTVWKAQECCVQEWEKPGPLILLVVVVKFSLRERIGLLHHKTKIISIFIWNKKQYRCELEYTIVCIAVVYCLPSGCQIFVEAHLESINTSVSIKTKSACSQLVCTNKATVKLIPDILLKKLYILLLI